MLLTEPLTEFPAVQKDTIKRLVEETPESYLFKKVESLIVRFRPEFTNDTRFFYKPPEGSGDVPPSI